MTEEIVIVGASIAGVNAVKELRKKGYDGNITMIDQQSELPYDLLPLSKEWMQDKEDIDPPLLKKQSYYDDNKITLQLNTTVEGFDPKAKTVQTDQGEFKYDKLVLAIGSVLRNLDVPGIDAEGVFSLRDFKQASAIKRWAKNDVKKLVIVGAGFIGLEMASTFSQWGLDVTVVEFSDHPLGRIIGEDASGYFTKMHESHGVHLLTGEAVQEFKTDEANHVTQAVTASGKAIDCDMAIVGIGVTPNTSISHPDLEFNRGIVVNEYGETSLPDVYAIGDCTVWPYKDQVIHVEHWEHAHDHGKMVARNLMNAKSTVYDIRPYFWTDEYDQTFEYLGHATAWDKTILRGSLEDRQWTIAYVDKSNYPIAILFANEGDKRDDVSDFMDKNQAIDEAKFKDMSNPLSEM